MIIPYGASTKCDCHRSTDIRCMEYSPDGKLVAMVSTQTIQIWSEDPCPVLLASLPQKRPAACNKALLRNESLFWKPDGTMICVIRGEGIAEFYKVTSGIYEIPTSYDEDNNRLEYPFCTLESLQRIAIDGYGLPTSSCAGDHCIFIGTDNGNIVSLLWHGILNSVSLTTLFNNHNQQISSNNNNRNINNNIDSSNSSNPSNPSNPSNSLNPSNPSNPSNLSNSLNLSNPSNPSNPSNLSNPMTPASPVTPASPAICDIPSNVIIMAIDYHQEHRYMCITLSTGESLLLLPPKEPLNVLCFSGVVSIQKKKSTLCAIGKYRDIIALGNEDSTISCYNININENNEWSVPFAFNLSLYTFNGIKDEGLLGIEVMRWCEHNDALAVGYNRKGLIVWNMQDIPIYTYMENIEEEIDPANSQKPGVHALCWSKYNDSLLYASPYEQVYQEGGSSSLDWEGQIYLQPFIVYENTYLCTPSRGLWCRGSNQLLYIYQDTIDIKRTYKHIYDIPPMFLKKNYPFHLMCSNPQGDKVCIASTHGIAVMDQKTMEWYVYNELIDGNSYLSCLCWYKSDILLLCVKKPRGSYIYAYRYNGIVIDKCMQEINIDTDDVLKDIQIQDNNIYILTNTMSILTFEITTVDSTKYADVLPIIPGNKFLLPPHCRYSRCLLPIPSSSISIYLDPMNIYNMSNPQDKEEMNMKKINSEIDSNVYEFENTNICLIYGEEGSLDMINFTQGMHRHMYDNIQQVFISIAPPELPLKLRVSFWYPLIDPSFDRTSEVPVFSPMGYVYKNTPIYILPHIGCCISNVNNRPAYMKKDALQLETHSIIHLLLWYLLNMQTFSVSRYMLLYFYNHNIPHLSSSLEYLLHISLNSATSAFLRYLLNLLSVIPIFPRILTTCLRKQERSTWPYVIRNRTQSLKMFHLFMKSRDMEFASTSLALVQGLLCTVSENYNDMLELEKEREEIKKKFVESKEGKEKESDHNIETEKTKEKEDNVEKQEETKGNTIPEVETQLGVETIKEEVTASKEEEEEEEVISVDKDTGLVDINEEKESIELNREERKSFNTQFDTMNNAINTNEDICIDYNNIHTDKNMHEKTADGEYIECPLCIVENMLNVPNTITPKTNRSSGFFASGITVHKEDPIECTAHICGLRLLFVSIYEERWNIASEAFRFIVMEEQRHEDAHIDIPKYICLDTCLSRYCYYLLTKAKILEVLKIIDLFPFEWSPFNNTIHSYEMGDIHIDDYYEMIQTVKQQLKWIEEETLRGPPVQLIKDDVDSIPLVIETQLPSYGDDAVSTEEIEKLLVIIMKANVAQWSLLLMTLLMKTQKASLIAEARPDIWNQLKDDINRHKDEAYTSFVRNVDQQVEKRRKEKEELDG
ncbi:hypothetical protein WA158_005748 [Blastocystis sp. Blastoise]